MSLVEIEFKGKRKGIFKNPQEFPLKQNDRVIVRADRGEDIGKVTLIGHEWDDFINEANEAEENEAILRLAGKEDETREIENRKLEKDARGFFVDEVKKLSLEMKLVDIEYQFDRRKLTFYFTADGRVDFRELVKVLANNFHTRIDLRQIGARDESKRLGGLGLCGRELCCASWIRDFKPVTTLMLKEQNLLLNPQKNTGLCGKLRCCLRYEVDQYRDVNLKFPKPETTKVKGPRGDGIIEKVNFCHASIGVIWSDGHRASYTEENLKELTNWDIEKREEFKLLEFSRDPSIEEAEKEKESQLVASYEPPSAKFGKSTDSGSKPSSNRKSSKGYSGPRKDGKPASQQRKGKPGRPDEKRSATSRPYKGKGKPKSSQGKTEIVVLRPIEKPVRSENTNKPKKTGDVNKDRNSHNRQSKPIQKSNPEQNSDKKESFNEAKKSNTNSNTSKRPPQQTGRRRKR